MNKKSDQKASKTKERADAKGQFAGSKGQSSSDGVDSADPRVLSKKKSGDATFPLEADKLASRRKSSS